MNRHLPALALPVLLGAAACAGTDTRFPSLMPRAIEAPVADPDAPALPAPSAPDGALTAQLRAIAGELGEAERAFDGARAAAEPAVRAAGDSAPGSEPWIAAQQQLSALDAARGRTRAVQAVLDELALARAQSGPAGSYAADQAAIAAAVAQAAAIAKRQMDAFEALNARLRQP